MSSGCGTWLPPKQVIQRGSSHSAFYDLASEFTHHRFLHILYGSGTLKVENEDKNTVPAPKYKTYVDGYNPPNQDVVDVSPRNLGQQTSAGEGRGAAQDVPVWSESQRELPERKENKTCGWCLCERVSAILKPPDPGGSRGPLEERQGLGLIPTSLT